MLMNATQKVLGLVLLSPLGLVMVLMNATQKDAHLVIQKDAPSLIQRNEICLIQAKAALMDVKIRSQMDALPASLMK